MVQNKILSHSFSDGKLKCLSMKNSFNYFIISCHWKRCFYCIFSLLWNDVLWHKIQTQMCHRSDWLNLPKGKIIMKIPREVNTSNVIISQPVGQHFWVHSGTEFSVKCSKLLFYIRLFYWYKFYLWIKRDTQFSNIVIVLEREWLVLIHGFLCPVIKYPFLNNLIFPFSIAYQKYFDIWPMINNP